MGLDVYFKVKMSSFTYRKPPAVFDNIPIMDSEKESEEDPSDSGRAWVDERHTVTLLSLGKAWGITEFVRVTLGDAAWKDDIAKVPKQKVCF